MELARVQTTLGTVVVSQGRDHAKRDRVKVDLIPAEGCTADSGSSIVREHSYDYPEPPSVEELVTMLRAVRRWLETPQHPNTRFHSHFGVYAPSFCGGRWTLQVHPERLTFQIADSHQLTTASHPRKAISRISEIERERIVEAITTVFGDELAEGTDSTMVSESIWDGPWFISCRFKGVSERSLLDAMERYGRRGDGSSVDVFSPQAQNEFSELLLPRGWHQ